MGGAIQRSNSRDPLSIIRRFDYEGENEVILRSSLSLSLSRSLSPSQRLTLSAKPEPHLKPTPKPHRTLSLSLSPSPTLRSSTSLTLSAKPRITLSFGIRRCGGTGYKLASITSTIPRLGLVARNSAVATSTQWF